MQRKIISLGAAMVLLLGCRPKIDPELKPFIGPQKDVSRFLSLSVNDQIAIYLRVSSLPLKPPDYSLAGLIATKDGDIGINLRNELSKQSDSRSINNLLVLAGTYCKVNIKCARERPLQDAAEQAVRRLPERMQNESTKQSLDWIRSGVRGTKTPPTP